MEQETQAEPELTYKLKAAQPTPTFPGGPPRESTPKTPGEWFSNKFPEQTQQYGPPVLEATTSDLEGFTHTAPVALNEDFFAAILGGDKRLGHSVVYYEEEQQFYFFDCRKGVYCPTSESKLMLLLSQYIIQCAAAMPDGVEIKDLFVAQRKDENLRKIVRRAKALLAADDTFFGEKSIYKRVKGIENHSMLAKSFVRVAIRPEPDSDLTVRECFENFNEYCVERGLEPINRRIFKSLIAEVIKEQYSLGLRHDVIGINQRQQQGWRGLVATTWRN